MRSPPACSTGAAHEHPQTGTSGLEPFRRRLDTLDEQIASLLGERFTYAAKSQPTSVSTTFPMIQAERVIEVRERYLQRGVEVNLPPDFTSALFDLLIGATCKLEDELLIDAPATMAEASEKCRTTPDTQCTSRGSNPDLRRLASPPLHRSRYLVRGGTTIGATIPYLLTDHTIGRGLPPGPRMPSTLQAVAWARRPLPFLDRCQKHFGDTFTIRVKHAGTWVILADPDDVKKVFTADHAVLGVGLANSILGPLLGPAR